MSRKAETLGARLKLARGKRGLSQGALAAKAGLKQPDISKLERGDMLKTTGMARLGSALRVPAAWLELGEGDEPNWDEDGPPAPPPGYRDRHEVDDSDWATLQAVKIMLTDQERADIRERHARVKQEAQKELADAAAAAKGKP